MDSLIVLLGLVAGGAAVLSTIALHRGRGEARDLRERIAALEVEVGKGPAHEEHTGGLPRMVDPTLRGRMAAAERAIERSVKRALDVARRRRVRKA